MKDPQSQNHSHRPSPESGMILLSVIILIVFVSISVYGVTIYIVEQMSFARTQQTLFKATYLAQAGVHQALYDYRNRALTGTGYVTKGQTTVATGETFTVGGTQADFFMVDISTAVKGGDIDPTECQIIGAACESDCWVIEADCDAACNAAEDQCNADADVIHAACLAACPPGTPGKSCRKACDSAHQQDTQDCHVASQTCKQNCTFNRQTCRTQCSEGEDACLLGNKVNFVYLRNATNSNTLTIDQMKFTWDDATIYLEQVVIGTVLYWSGSATSTATADLSPNFTVAADQTVYEIDYIQYSGSMVNATYCDVEFVMGDGSSKTVRIVPQANRNNFTVKASGKTSGSSVYKTLIAEYNTLTGQIVDYDESNTEITP